MDAQTFDHLIAEAARRSSRRTALRLLSAALLGTLLPARIARAQRPDRDQDGLFDDDEVAVYGTNPDVFDTDRDGIGDGEEIWNRDQGLAGPKNPLVSENTGPPPADPAPPPAATCIALGGQCVGIDLPCCGNDPATHGYNNVLCCPDLTGAGYCTDVTGRFTCPDPGVPATGCPAGQTDCGGFCTDLLIDHGNCGACGNRCSQVCGPDCNCVSGTCTKYCGGGLATCGSVCVDLQTDFNHCGACGHSCADIAGGPLDCIGGACLDVSEEPEAPQGGGGDDIDDVEDKADPCHPRDDGHPNDVCMETGEEAQEDNE